MRSIKNQITLIVLGVIVLLTMALMFVFYLQVQFIVQKETKNEAKRHLATAEAIIDLRCPGSWYVKGDTLYKGQTEINNNFVLVDNIKELTGGTCSIYLNNVCVATTVIDGACNIRAVGKPVPKEVKSETLEAGHYYLGQAEIEEKINQTAYKPIINDEGQALGVLYIGTKRTLYNSIIYRSLKMIGLAGLILALLVGLLTRIFTDRTLVKPLQELIKGIQEAAACRAVEPLKIKSSNEIGELTKVFNRMLEAQEAPNKMHKNEKQPPLDANIGKFTIQEQVHGRSNVDSDIDLIDTFLDSQKELPKGLNPITLKEIVLFLKEKEVNEVTVKDVSNEISLSDVTVRRYLDFLDESGIVEIEQQYGSVGRPLRIYKLKE